jgi:hypothetical protein
MIARQRESIGIAKEQPEKYAVLADGEPGDYVFTVDANGTIAGIEFICPGRRLHGITFKPGSWQWNGNRERPSVTPSIASRDGCCGMHVYLTDGQWVLCGDHGRLA